jgi:uncharacterized protein (TIGR03437 family)
MLLLTVLSVPAVPALAQTTIGGGVCTSATLTGTYEFLLNGRQLTSTGTVTKVFQGIGTASFDGLSKVTMTLTANTVTSAQSFGTAVVYAGSYSMQSNCVGTITINSGDTATFTLTAYNQAPTATAAASFAGVGSDASYAYNGTGNNQPASCPATITGAHEFNGTGSALSGASVTSTLDVDGILQFDGAGNVSANWTQASNLTATQVKATGTYSVGTGCLASATLIDTATNKYTFALSFSSASPAFAFMASSPQLIFDGSGAAMQPAAITACGASMLTGTYELTLSGRLSPAGVATKILASDGTATFDGQGKVTFNLTSNAVNGSQVFGTPLMYTGTYSLQSSCTGSINITGGDTATLAIVAYDFDTTTQQAKAFYLVGTDAIYAYNGSGTVQPSACATSTLSGEWPFNGTGNSLSGSTNTGVEDLAGVMQFDGQGTVTASWTAASNSGMPNFSATGTYSLTAACVGSLTLMDTSNNIYTGAVTIYGVDANKGANDFEWTATSPQLIFTGAGHAAFVNPQEAVDNGASFVPGDTPAGSVFSIFGSNLATKVSQPTSVPLPTTALTTTVTVNGELAPLFYVSPGQINAQMPEDIQAGVATVIVKNGSSTSNAVAVMMPATGTPGISTYGNNRAAVVNQDGSLNSTSAPAKVGDVLTAYFTGGGPVDAAGKVTSGDRSPAGLSWVTGTYSVTVGGVQSNTINYMGLTPGSIGLYQANFVLPSVAAGDHPVVITISGQESNAPLIAVK